MRTIRANGNIYDIFKPNDYYDGQNFYQDKTSLDMSLQQFENLLAICWKQKNQPITTDKTKDKYTGRYR